MALPSVSNVTFPPDRKIWAAGVAGIASWIILSILAKYGIDPQPILDSIFSLIGQKGPDAQGALAGLIALGIAYYVPPSMKDIVKRINDTTIEIARASDDSPASEVAPRMTPAVAEKVIEVTGNAPATGPKI